MRTAGQLPFRIDTRTVSPATWNAAIEFYNKNKRKQGVKTFFFTEVWGEQGCDSVPPVGGEQRLHALGGEGFIHCP
jgi:hypothetical protein